MSRIDINMSSPCPSCGASANVGHVQSYYFQRLNYSQSLHCETCGTRIEADGGEPEPEIHDALVAAHGLWRTRLESGTTNRSAIVACLMSGLVQSRSDALQVLRAAPVDVFEGTQPEAERWRDALVAAGATATWSRSD